MAREDDVELYGRFWIALKKLESCEAFASLVPEVRSNLVYVKKDAASPADVLAVDGRITVVAGLPRAAGDPVLGSSSHMARLVLELRKTDPAVRAGIAFANDPGFSQWLEGYCGQKGWVFSVMDRTDEPADVAATEGASMPWKVAKAIEAAGGRLPKVFYENAAPGKEPVSVLVGPDPIAVVDDVCDIARKYLGKND